LTHHREETAVVGLSLKKTATQASAGVAFACAALSAVAQQDAVPNPAAIERLGGFGEGVASGMMAPSMLRGQRRVKGENGESLVVRTFRDGGRELQVWLGRDGAPHYESLVIGRPGFALPMGLRIGDARGLVESTLGAAVQATASTLVYRRTAHTVEGCSDPVTFTFEQGKLARVAWQWESCMD
jgi:hypothetical protein